MKNFILAGVITTIISGCVSHRTMSGPSGNAMHVISCKGAVGWSGCYQKASELCRGKGYNTENSFAGDGVYGNWNQSGGFVTTTSSRELHVTCKQIVEQSDVSSWKGQDVGVLDDHAFFLALPVISKQAPNGVEVRNYVNGNGNAICNNIFYIKDGKVLKYEPMGNCHTDDTVSPTNVITQPIVEPDAEPCDCPFNIDKDGSICGDRSAYTRSGGKSPQCY